MHTVKESYPLLGKITVKTLALSILDYILKVLPSLSKANKRKLEQVLRSFIWDGKKTRIAMSILEKFIQD